jgi:hypothetical protein
MTLIPKAIRIEPAFENREQIRSMFERNAPYRALASYAPEGIKDEAREGAEPVLPWFRGDWALGGKPLVEGAEAILHSKAFLDAAEALFATSSVYPEFVVVNINTPMPACRTHIDNPTFHGATRVDYPLPFLRVMGSSGLFESWRVVRASTLSWFYEGAGGSFDYWPEGSMVQCGANSHPSAMLLCVRTLIGYTTALVASAIPMRRCPTCRQRRRFNRMTIATGQFSKMERFVQRTQAMPFASPFSGKQ